MSINFSSMSVSVEQHLLSFEVLTVLLEIILESSYAVFPSRDAAFAL
jgi:hypothetical protein